MGNCRCRVRARRGIHRCGRVQAFQVSGDRCTGRDSRGPDLSAHVFISEGADLRGRFCRNSGPGGTAIAPSHRRHGGSHRTGVSVSP